MSLHVPNGASLETAGFALPLNVQNTVHSPIRAQPHLEGVGDRDIVSHLSGGFQIMYPKVLQVKRGQEGLAECLPSIQEA